MKRSDIKALILTGDGINCEHETSLAFLELGIQTKIMHIYDLIENKACLDGFQILALPGGFSFGDEIGSGQVLSLKLKYNLGEEIKKFIAEGKLMIGICNGFQALVRMGLLPNPLEEREMTLGHNRQGHFINNWVDLNVLESKCVWTNELINKKIKLPIRHGEGRIHFKGDLSQQKVRSDKLFSEKQIPLVYQDDVNGSYAKIAGVCDPTGRILGMMPHPEAAISFWLNPSGSKKSEEAGMGLYLFESGIQYCEKNL